MFEFLAFITNKRYWKLHSFLVKVILRLYGIKVGKNFYIEGVSKLKIRGKTENIIIGNNVSIMGDIDLRNRENGKIIFKDNVTIENGCRFVSARKGVIIIGEGTIVGAHAIWNGGADIRIGKKCLFAWRSSINANDHITKRNKYIKDQGFVHAPVVVEDDCWFGVNVAINKGVNICKGSVIASNAVVVKDTEEYSINAGIPAKKLAERKGKI